MENVSGQQPASGHETRAGIDDTGRARIAAIGDATRAVQDAADAIAANEAALTETQTQIAALDKIVKPQTRIDLVREQMEATRQRRAGL